MNRDDGKRQRLDVDILYKPFSFDSPCKLQYEKSVLKKTVELA